MPAHLLTMGGEGRGLGWWGVAILVKHSLVDFLNLCLDSLATFCTILIIMLFMYKLMLAFLPTMGEGACGRRGG